MEVHHERGPARQLDQAQAPGQALAEEKIVAVMQDGRGEQLAFSVLNSPLEPDRKAVLASFARGILDRPAVATLLQLEAPERGGSREAERDAAARRRRKRRQA